MTKDQFLRDVSGWNNHLPLLWLGLEDTQHNKHPVIEFGSGLGSTPILKQYCKDAGREFLSYDNNAEWAEQMGSILIPNWSTAEIYKRSSVILVDCAPGESRHEIMAIMKDRADIIIVHDTEKDGSGNYLYEKIWPLFKFRINLTGGSTWASAVSNTIDLSIFVGNEFGQYKVTS